MREELDQLELALAALDEVIAVRTEYVELLQRLGSAKRELAALDALLLAQTQLQAKIDDISSQLKCRAIGRPLSASRPAPGQSSRA
jgi:hypothetical protein